MLNLNNWRYIKQVTFEAENIFSVIKNVQSLILTLFKIQLIENVPNDDCDEMYETFFRAMPKLTPLPRKWLPNLIVICGLVSEA